MKYVARVLGILVILGVLIIAILTFFSQQIMEIAVGGVLVPLPANITYIHFSTEPCFGNCPVYKMTITASEGHDGTLEWEGKEFTCIKGPISNVVPRAELDRLIQQFEDAKFFTFSRVNWIISGDEGTFRVDASIKGQRNSVPGSFGYNQGQPPALDDLAKALVDIAATSGWVLRCDEPGY